MKKLFCAALALILLAGSISIALAGSAQPAATPDPKISGGNPGAEGGELPADASNAGAEGGELPTDASNPGADRVVDVDGQYSFVCPGALSPVDLAARDMTDGLLFSAFSDTMGVDVYKYERGADTVLSLYEVCKVDDSLQEVTLADIGGVKALVYRIDETGINVTVAGDTGFFYDIMITYQTPEEYQQVGALIASIKKAGA